MILIEIQRVTPETRERTRVEVNQKTGGEDGER